MDANVKAAQNLDELFDVVDEQDRVLRQATRRDVHANHWLHRAVHVLIFNQAGEIYLQQRSLLKDVAPGTWGASCAGHLDAGEDYDAAAVRELGEELGLTDLKEAPQRWLRFRPSEATGWEFVWVYRLHHEGPFTLNEAEVAAGGWFARAQIDDGVMNYSAEFSESFKEIWKRVSEEL